VTVVPPEKVFAPPNTNSPAPDFDNDPAPVIAPLTVSAVVASAFENVDPPASAIETVLPTVNAPVPDTFWIPLDPNVSVCAEPAPKDTAFDDDMLIPKTEMPAVNVGLCTAVKVFKKSAVSAEVGTPPNQDPAALKSVEPCTQLIPAPCPTEGDTPSNTVIISASPRPTTPRLTSKKNAIGGNRRYLALPALNSVFESATII
jgi:hypothetical protein